MANYLSRLATDVIGVTLSDDIAEAGCYASIVPTKVDNVIVNSNCVIAFKRALESFDLSTFSCCY